MSRIPEKTRKDLKQEAVRWEKEILRDSRSNSGIAE